MTLGYAVNGECIADPVEAAGLFCGAFNGISSQGGNTCTLATITGGQIEWRLTTVTANPSNSYSRTQTQNIQRCEVRDLAYWEPVILAFFVAAAGILAVKLVMRGFSRDSL